MMRNRIFMAVFVAVLAFATMASAATVTLNTINGDWANPAPATGVTIDNSGSPHTVRWGTSTGFGQSGYDWLAASLPVNATVGTTFSLGQFTHINQPVTGVWLTSVDLIFTVGNFTTPSTLGATFLFSHNETPNGLPCNPSGNTICPDVVTISNAFFNDPFSVGSNNYYFTLLGFSQNNGATISTQFITEERLNNVADLYAIITAVPYTVPEPASLLFFVSGLAGLAALGFRRRS